MRVELTSGEVDKCKTGQNRECFWNRTRSKLAVPEVKRISFLNKQSKMHTHQTERHVADSCLPAAQTRSSLV